MTKASWTVFDKTNPKISENIKIECAYFEDVQVYITIVKREMMITRKCK